MLNILFFLVIFSIDIYQAENSEYSVSVDPDSFRIEPTTGKGKANFYIKVVNASVLDYEKRTSIHINVSIFLFTILWRR